MNLEELTAHYLSGGRVCPQPPIWNDLWQLLPGRVQRGAGWEPPLPLILAAWNFASASEKKERFLLHLRWADEHSVLPLIADFLSKLSAKDWHTDT